MVISNILIPLLSGTNLITIILLIKNWKSDKIKNNADSKITEFKATQEIVNIYKNMYNDVKDNYEYQLKKAFEQIKILEKDIEDLKNFKCEKPDCPNREQ